MKKLMKFLSARVNALIAIALLLLAVSTVGITKANLEYFSDDYVAWFYLNHLQVHLLENGRDVCGGHNDLDGVNKITGELVQYLGYSEGNPGTVEPGKKYEEVIQAKNGTDIDQYLRLTVRKYWVDPDGKKTTALEPSLIHLTYGDSDYNSTAWTINKSESTEERATYYYKSILPGGNTTAALFDTLQIDGKIIDNMKTETRTEGNKTIFTYTYQYDGYTFYIEADVQAIQTHNVMDAIHSQWGVYNVTAGNGSLSVAN